MVRFTFPETYTTANCVLVPINQALIPFVSGALKLYEQRGYWYSDEDFEQAYTAFVELQANMNNDCLQKLTEGVDRIYRLLDTALNGTQYAQIGEEISPPISAVPPANSTAANAMRAQVRRLHQLAENAATAAEYSAGSALEGTVGLDYDGSWAARFLALQGASGGFLGIGEVPTTLTHLLKAGRVNTEEDKTTISDAMDTVSDAISIGDNIKDTITDFLGTAAELGTDGGVIAVNMAVGAAQLQLLKRLIRAIDGGDIFSPTDNLLRAVRGDTPADNDHNVVAAADRINTRTGTVQDAVTQLQGELVAKLNEIKAALPDGTTPLAPLIDQVEDLLDDIKAALQ